MEFGRIMIFIAIFLVISDALLFMMAAMYVFILEALGSPDKVINNLRNALNSDAFACVVGSVIVTALAFGLGGLLLLCF